MKINQVIKIVLLNNTDKILEIEPMGLDIR